MKYDAEVIRKAIADIKSGKHFYFSEVAKNQVLTSLERRLKNAERK